MPAAAGVYSITHRLLLHVAHSLYALRSAIKLFWRLATDKRHPSSKQSTISEQELREHVHKEYELLTFVRRITEVMAKSTANRFSPRRPSISLVSTTGSSDDRLLARAKSHESDLPNNDQLSNDFIAEGSPAVF